MKQLTGLIGLFFLITALPAQAQLIAGDGVWSAPDTSLVQSYQPEAVPKENGETRSYTVPFASEGNAIKLAVVNTASQAISGLEVTVEGIPEWLEMNPQTFTIGELTAGAETIASFTFHLKKQAPVGQRADIIFSARDGQQFAWNKTIELKVAAPTGFEISQNYPNPFTATTKMDMVLPAPMQVEVIIYDVLGRKVETVMNAQRPAGGDTMEWDASNMASGLYFCVMKAENMETGKQITEMVKMMVIK